LQPRTCARGLGDVSTRDGEEKQVGETGAEVIPSDNAQEATISGPTQRRKLTPTRGTRHGYNARFPLA
jgi:hypothetical protein